MNKPSFSDPIDPAIQRYIETVALKYSRLHRLPSANADDLAQVLAIKYLHLRATCDRSKLANWKFLQRALVNACHSYLRYLKAKTRWPTTHLQSLDASVRDGRDRRVAIGQTLRDPESTDEPRRHELRRKMKDIGGRHPAIERLRLWVEQTSRRPMRSQLEAVARASGFRSVDEMRQFFEDEGLRDLL